MIASAEGIKLILHRDSNVAPTLMTAKVLLPREFCDDEAVRFVARRYHATPAEVLVRFLVQDGIVCRAADNVSRPFDLAPNEMALLRDLGVKPTAVELR